MASEVAEFTGALPEPNVREWLTQLGPSPADVAYDEGAALEAEGQLDAAADRYRRALAEAPAHAEAAAALNRVELAQRAAGLDRSDLEQRAGAGDIDAILDLADLEAQSRDFDAAFGRLVDALRQTRGDDRERIASAPGRPSRRPPARRPACQRRPAGHGQRPVLAAHVTPWTTAGSTRARSATGASMNVPSASFTSAHAGRQRLLEGVEDVLGPDDLFGAG